MATGSILHHPQSPAPRRRRAPGRDPSDRRARDYALGGRAAAARARARRAAAGADVLRLHGYEVDFLWRAANLVVEVDGLRVSLIRSAFGRDRRRDADLTRAGYRSSVSHGASSTCSRRRSWRPWRARSRVASRPMDPRPPVPPFTLETARQKVKAAEDAWNTRDPSGRGPTHPTRGGATVPRGPRRDRRFLTRKWARELDLSTPGGMFSGMRRRMKTPSRPGSSRPERKPRDR